MLINGEPATAISVADRGLAYGDGVFETFRVFSGHLLFREEHLERLRLGCERLGISLDLEKVRKEIDLALQSESAEPGVLKLIVTRDSNGRGYRFSADAGSIRIITLHALPANIQTHAENGVNAFVCRQRLGSQPGLAGIKHLNRLEQVLASGEWPDETYQEGIMLDLEGNVVEGTRSNLFIVKNGRLTTDPLNTCGIAGVMRKILLQHFADKFDLAKITLDQLYSADEVFFCNSIFGVWPLRHLTSGTSETHYATGPITQMGQSIFNKHLSLA
jgi:4-amino-4-deoxychorismate lyase